MKLKLLTQVSSFFVFVLLFVLALAPAGPVRQYGLYLGSVDGLFFSPSSLNVLDPGYQHFAIFSPGLSATSAAYWIGVGSFVDSDEDAKHPNKIRSITEPPSLALMGIVLISVSFFLRRRYRRLE